MNIEAASRYHRYIIVSVLVFLLSAYLLKSIPVLQTVIGVAIWAFNVFCCYKLAAAIGKTPLLWAVLGFVGFMLLWIPHLLLLNAANKLFRARGMKIGFLGGAKGTGQPDTGATGG